MRKPSPAALLQGGEIRVSIQEGRGCVSIKTIELPISGMHCAGCAARIEKVLSKLPGVQSANVNLATERATIAYDPELVSPEDLKHTIEGLGYEVPKDLLESPTAVETQGQEQYAHKSLESKLLLKTIISATLTLPILLGALGVIPLLSNPWLLWALATPVQFWGGLQFYAGAFAAARQKTADMSTLIATGSSAAYLYSAALVLFPGFFRSATGFKTALFFDTSAVIITLILFGRLLELHARGRTSRRDPASDRLAAEDRPSGAGQSRDRYPGSPGECRRHSDRTAWRTDTGRWQGNRRTFLSRRIHDLRRAGSGRKVAWG